MSRRRSLLIALLAGALLAGAAAAEAAQAFPLPRINIAVDEAKNPQELSGALQVMLLLTVLSLAPSLLILLTSFSRIVIVLGLLRQALGTPQMPPSQVLIGLALFLTAFVMAPVAAEVRDQAYTPYMTKKITQDEALQRALRPIREFMLRQTREQDLALMLRLSKAPRPRTREEVPTTALIPAFVISELKSGFASRAAADSYCAPADPASSDSAMASEGIRRRLMARTVRRRGRARQSAAFKRGLHGLS